MFPRLLLLPETLKILEARAALEAQQTLETVIINTTTADLLTMNNSLTNRKGAKSALISDRVFDSVSN